MRYILFIDVQNDYLADGALGSEPSRAALAKEVASRIFECAYQLKGREDIFTCATRQVNVGPFCKADTPGAELFGCLGSLVNARPIRNDHTSSTFPSIAYRITLDERPPAEIAVCGFLSSGMVIRAALYFRSVYPGTKVTILDDLCFDFDPVAHEAALLVAQNNGISVESGQKKFGYQVSGGQRGGDDA